MTWRDRPRKLSLALASGSRMVGAGRQRIEVRVAGGGSVKTVTFTGQHTTIELSS
jgi:hypothetical protein